VRVDVHLTDGSVHSETREAPRGSEQSFGTRDDIVEKFKKLSRAALPVAQQNALVDAVLGADDLPDARRIVELMRTV
jgi:2-methylcitrate dehydratase PrpD